MKCPRCQHENHADAVFCDDCGARLEVRCPACGEGNRAGAKFCRKCGQALSATEPPAPRPHPVTSEAERRQLTVMFCDLVGSTALAEQLDPEDFREVIRAYQTACAGVIQRFGGHIAQYLGDGLLVYFGYPHAHDDDARRAIQSGLAIVSVLYDLNAKLHAEKGVRVAIRVGIHTGPVVVGEIGGEVRREQLALGETPNLAARLQGLAEPGTVVISAKTQRLVQGLFVCSDIGVHSVKGVSAPVQIYQVLRASEAHSRLEIAGAHVTPLVGREQEVSLLLHRWEQVRDGLGQVVLVSGEAGIGKSRLVGVLKDRVAHEPHVRWECRCSPYYQDSALYPIIDLIHRVLEFRREESAEDKFRKIELGLTRYGLADRDNLILWAALLSVPLPDRDSLLSLSPERQRQKTLEAVVRLLLALAAHDPVLFIVEDVHWIDPSTLELLQLIVDQVPTAPVLMLLTFRPDFQPLWSHRAHITAVTVGRFTRKQTEVMVDQVTQGKALPAEVLQQVVARTDGVPLFVEELTKMVLESGLLREQGDRYELTGPLPPLAIPTTLQDSLMARLDRLATVKALAQLGATLGRTFSYELLRAVSVVDEATLQHALERLREAELLYQRGVAPQATYVFKHALIQEAAYQSLLKSTRQQYHQRIAEVLQEQFPEVRDVQPELLAHHYTEAGLQEQAVAYWQKAGKRAGERSANLEAIAHLTRGLKLLKGLPESRERLQHELNFQLGLGPVLMAAKGYAAPEVEETYSRARDLCRQIGDAAPLFLVLFGLYAFYLVRPDLRASREAANEALTLAERQGDPGLLLEGHIMVGVNFFFKGDFTAARPHLERALALYDPEPHRSHALLYVHHPAVNAGNILAQDLWCLGYADSALARIREQLTLARELAHPYSLTYTLTFAAWIHHYRREAAATRDLAEAALKLAAEHDVAFFVGHATVLRGWALAHEGHGREAIADIQRGVRAYRATGAELERPYWLLLLAEALANDDDIAAAADAVAEALEQAKETEAHFCEAELYRIKGDLLVARSPENEAEAEACLHRAIEVARGQSAKSLELRASLSLSRLCQRQGKREEARRVLGDVYGWFTEGFDTPDLRDAKALLDDLSRS